ncbi:flagellin N-terminal helical domain-containing protein [Denitromonas ohlonensis]|uniref:Flagellin n=2 Tax=Denitromonas TaxID=139331 RepID=A0A557S153_9RHOO|nr:flagellin [Denitromonas ohlonensis]TVO59900.1 flagellin FliC [Denitromonas ohlonensis]TVO71155.1 flagellin FliC [Denitromonas ohlonensis]
MAQVINTNVYSLNAQRNLNRSQEGLATSLQRLSSGLRVNSARDDAAGLAVAQRMEADARGLTVAMRNASDGISFSQTADGALGTSADILQRMRELTVQSLNGTISDTERGYLNAEYQQLNTELGRLQGAAKLNNQSVFGSFTFQIGAGSGDSMSAAFASVASLSAAGTSSIGTTASAVSALSAIDDALNSVASNRATIGGVMGRMQFTIQQLETARENQYAARSRIMDADFAAETAALTRAQILQQSGTAMVAQANSVPQSVLSLLQG